MNPRLPNDPWQRFAAAARQGAAMAPPPPLPAPSGFVARVVAQAMQARREFVALLWERWSWRMALATAAIALALGGWVLRHPPAACLDVPPLTLDVPTLESP